MTIEAAAAAIAAAEAYEGLHVPALFAQWAPRVVAAAGIGPGDRVLDVACGTGVVAREAAIGAGPTGSVTGLDADAGMLAVAARMAPSIEWRQGRAESLPFADDAFDAVVSQFGLMFFRDRVGALREMRRVLAPGGRLAVAVWDALERSEAYPLAVDLLERRAGKRAADALRAPFVLGDPAALAALFADAGFDDATVTTETGTARFPDVRTMVEADLRGWLPIMGVELADAAIEAILEEADEVLGHYRTSGGAIEFSAPAHVVSAGRPLLRQ